jgi:hypothetical protein
MMFPTWTFRQACVMGVDVGLAEQNSREYHKQGLGPACRGQFQEGEEGCNTRHLRVVVHAPG